MINSRLQNGASASPQSDASASRDIGNGNRKTMLRKMSAGLGIAAALILSGNSFAFAEAPEAASAILTDHADVIENDAAISAEIAKLSQGQLRIMMVETLAGYDPSNWAKTSFDATPALSENDALVVIATEDRKIGWHADSDSGITSSDIEYSLDSNVTDAFGDGDWDAGLTTFIANLQAVSGTTSSTDSTSTTADGETSDSSTSSSSGFGSGALLLGGTVLAVGGGVYAFQKRSRNKTELEKAKKLKALAERASGSLLAADDATRTAEAELEFARAEFGFEATQEYAKTLGQARSSLEQAFILRRALDDTEPETPAQQWDMNAQIITLVESAQASLKSQEEWFANLRNLAQRSEELLGEYQSRINESEARLPLARTQISQLEHSFSPQAINALKTYPEQVQTLLNSAKELQVKAQELVNSGNRNGTVPYLKMIEETLSQSGKLLSRIDAAPQLLRDAQQRYTQNTESLRSDLADAERLGRGIPAIEQAALTAKAVIDNYSGSSAIDFLAANEELQSAEAKLDAALVNVREQEENQRRLAAHVETAQRTARDAIDDADEFISRYRSGIGSSARTYLARAKATYNEGLNVPLEQKLSRFESARQIAQQAIDAAQQSLDRNDYNRGGRNGGAGDFLAGVIVSSILNGITNSSNSRRSGFDSDIFGGTFGSGGGFGGGGIDFGGGGGFSGGSKGF